MSKLSMSNKTKMCPMCKKEKPFNEFSPQPRNGPKSKRCYCKKCGSQLATEWAKQNPIKRNKNWRSWRYNNYGITFERYEEMVKQQNSVCAICFAPQKLLKMKLFVDHDHKTGKVRALLCYKCNTMLGAATDNPEILRRAAEYLEKHRASM